MFNFDFSIQKFLILAPTVLFAITIHEFSHGLMAYYLGDPTAKEQGRLTLNPLKHLSLVGTLVFVITQMIGWAKPVPINNRNFKDPKLGMILVAIAGPASNIVVAILSAFVVKAYITFLGVPSGGNAHFLLPVFYMAAISIRLNIALAIFNLIPIPPLDGSWVLLGILPESLKGYYRYVETFSIPILVLLIFTGLLDRIIVPLVRFADRILIGPII